MRADGYNYSQRLGKREFPSITLSAVLCCIFSANPNTPAAFLSTIEAKLLRVACDLVGVGDAAFGENGAFDPL
jgi:hypothetical protein